MNLSRRTLLGSGLLGLYLIFDRDSKFELEMITAVESSPVVDLFGRRTNSVVLEAISQSGKAFWSC